jgi:hypothetical protein
MSIDIGTWAKNLSERLTEKVKHVYDVVDQKLEYQHKYLEQRLDNIHNVQSEKLLNFSVRLEEALAEIRGYKDILQQQLTVVDSATKRAHERIDQLSETSKERDNVQDRAFDKLEEHVRQTLEDQTKKVTLLEDTLTKLKAEVVALQQNELIETTQKRTLKEDPVRKFLSDNAQKILILVLSGIGIYVLRNLGAILQSIAP